MKRSKGVGPGARILFGLISGSSPSSTSPTPIFCLCRQKGSWGNPDSWELIIDDRYDPSVIEKVAGNGARMGLQDLVKLAKVHAQTTYPNG